MAYKIKGTVTGSIELTSPGPYTLANSLSSAGLGADEARDIATELITGPAGPFPKRHVAHGIEVARDVVRGRRVYTINWYRVIGAQGDSFDR